MGKNLIGMGLIAALALSVQATTVAPLSLEEMTRRSDSIVVGKATSVTYGFNNRAGYPETRTTFTVESGLYGDSTGESVVVCLPGGPAGNGLVTVVPGMPKFKVDERAVLFLVKDKSRDVAIPTGLEQGVFRIKVDPNTDESYVFNQSRDLSSIGQSAISGAASTKDAAKQRLFDFELKVRQLTEKVKQK